MKFFFGLAVVAMALLPSFASAAYTYTETVSVVGTNPVRMTAREFTFYAYPGQQIEASVTFTATPAGDVDLRLLPPGGSCSLPPLDVLTAADCVIFTAGNRIADPLCENGPNRRPIQAAPSGSDSASAIVERGGQWRAVVMFPTGGLQARYTLTLSVDGNSPGVSGPVAASYVIGNPACSLP